MEGAPKVFPPKFAESMRLAAEDMLQEVMQSVNDAPDGDWISGSEEQVRDRFAVFREQAYQAALQARIDAAEAAFPPPQTVQTDPVTQQPVTKRKRNKGKQRTSRLTINGRVHLRRRWWHAAGDGSECPADGFLAPPTEGVSRGVREMACRENKDASGFAAAADNLARTAQVKMSTEQLRQVVEAEGLRVKAAQESGALPPAFRAEDCQVPGETTTRMYAGIDGVMVPTITDAEKQQRRKKVLEKRRQRGRKCKPLPPRKKGTNNAWKEFKTVTFYNQDQSRRHLRLSRCRRPQTGVLVRREAQQLGLSRADEKVAIVDGASWISQMLEGVQHALQLDAVGLDFYHLSENVHKTRRAVFGEDAAGTQWADALMHTFKHEGYEAAWDSLCQWRPPLRGGKRKAADRLINYVVDRREMINYPEFMKKQWDIGSGPTESRCKIATRRLNPPAPAGTPPPPKPPPP